MKRILLLLTLLIPLNAYSADLVNFGGFEPGTVLETLSSAGTIAVQGTTKRTGNYALQVNPTGGSSGSVNLGEVAATGSNAQAFTGTDTTVVYAEFQFQVGTLPAVSNEEMFRVVALDGFTHFNLRINSSGQLQAYNVTTLLATGATALSTGTWYRIEVLANTGIGAAWEVKIDGVSEISGTATLGTAWTALALGKVTNRNTNDVDFYYDDWAFATSGYVGNVGCLQALPNADGSPQQWTSGTGPSDYTQVDENALDTADYIARIASGGALVGRVEVQDSATLGISSNILAVKPYTAVRNMDFTTTSTLLRLVSVGTTADSATWDTNNVTTIRYIVYNTDPDTASAWTTGALDAIQLGIV